MAGVIGQTGRVLLSDAMVRYKKEQKRTLRYQYSKLSGGCYLAWICGPFHSRTYGVCGFGTDKMRSKAALQRRLANDYRYHGGLMFSDHDAADDVGEFDTRLSDGRVPAGVRVA